MSPSVISKIDDSARAPGYDGLYNAVLVTSALLCLLKQRSWQPSGMFLKIGAIILYYCIIIIILKEELFNYGVNMEKSTYVRQFNTEQFIPWCIELCT